MIQFLITGLAGLACGVVLMRILQQSKPQSLQAQAPQSETEGVDAPPAPQQTPFSTRNILMAAGAISAVAIAAIAFKGNDASPAADGTTPVAATGPGGAKALDDVDTMMAKLEARLRANPTDGEGFRMLGWSYNNTGKPEKAVDPYKRAVALLPGRADVQAGYGEALVGAAKGIVTPEAKLSFDQAMKLDSKEPRARFFEALFKSQNGQEKEALDEWIALANGGPADAAWLPDVRARITKLASKLGVDVSSRLKAGPPSAPALSALPGAPSLDPATVQSVNALPATDRYEMINGMVEKLAQRLKTNPGDAEGWAKLIRSRMVLNDPKQAASDLGIARLALAKDAQGLAMINAVAKELAVPGVS